LNDREIAVKLHDTDIILIHKDGSYTLNTGKWQTSTTKDRLNRFSPARIIQKNGVWYLKGLDGTTYYPFADGMGINSSGVPTAPVVNESDRIGELKRKLDKMVSTYIKGYCSSVVNARGISLPSNGDCWGCIMKDVKEDRKTQPIGDRQPMGFSHFFDHFREKYYVPSIVHNAILEAHYNNPAVIWEMIKGDAVNGRVDMLKSVLISYFRKLKPELLKMMI
jgi:hypothetical protein